MDLYNSQNMPLSLDNEIRTIQEKQLRGEKLNMSELLVLVRKDVGGRDHTTISSSYERAKKLIQKDEAFKTAVEKIRSTLDS